MIGYEWVIETLDEHEDIQSVDHADSYAEAARKAALLRAEGERVDVGLVRDRHDEIDGLQDRQWAYLEDGVLPAKFDGGATVPERYQREVRRNLGQPRPCNCGSGLPSRELADARGIYCGRVCDRCEERIKRSFRPEIWTDPHYYTDEPIEEED